MRLAKYLAHAGVASRRAAEDMIRAGRVTVHGAVVDSPATNVSDGDEVAVDGRPVGGAEQRVVYVLNKPAGVLSTVRDTHGRPTVVDLVDAGSLRLYPVGRLDADATGLILLTNDGALAQRLTHPRYEVPRAYEVTVSRHPVGRSSIAALREGVELDDGPTHPARVEQLAPDRLRIVIHEGRKHQVKRMCEAVGHPVLSLRRVAFGPLSLGRLARGSSRRLSEREVAALRAATGAG